MAEICAPQVRAAEVDVIEHAMAEINSMQVLTMQIFVGADRVMLDLATLHAAGLRRAREERDRDDGQDSFLNE